jgi:hypothetical protein
VDLSVVVRLREDKGGATREDRRPDRCHVTDTEQLCQWEMNWYLLTAAPSCHMYRSCAEGATRVSIAYIVRACGRARVCDGMRVCVLQEMGSVIGGDLLAYRTQIISKYCFWCHYRYTAACLTNTKHFFCLPVHSSSRRYEHAVCGSGYRLGATTGPLCGPTWLFVLSQTRDSPTGTVTVWISPPRDVSTFQYAAVGDINHRTTVC